MTDIKLELKKPLEKMTAKELRDLVINQLPMIQGASGMDKDTLLKEIKAALGMTEEGGGVSPYKAQIHGLKAKIRSLRKTKVAVEGEGARGQKDTLRRRINKLKKRSRRLARAA